MAWRNQSSQTGANNIPLGARRRFGGDSDDSPAPPSRFDEGSFASTPSYEGNGKRGRSPVKGKVYHQAASCQSTNLFQLNQTAMASRDARSGIDGEMLKRTKLRA